MDVPTLIAELGGTNAAARFFGLKPPSVTEWVKKGVIPESRLLKRAAALERKLPGKFSRRTQWPDEFAEIWPELVGPEPAQAELPLELLDRRAVQVPVVEDRRLPARTQDA